MLISLSYGSARRRLSVGVLRARGLRLLTDAGRTFTAMQVGSEMFGHAVRPAGVCVQVSLQIHTQAVKVKRSCAVRGDANPCFDHRATLRLRPQHLDEACLKVELQQQNPVHAGDSRAAGRASGERSLTRLYMSFSQRLLSSSGRWCWGPSCSPGAHSCSTGRTWSTHRSQSSCGTG